LAEGCGTPNDDMAEIDLTVMHPPVRRATKQRRRDLYEDVFNTASNMVLMFHLLKQNRVPGVSVTSQKQMGFIILRSLSENQSAHPHDTLTPDEVELLHSKMLRMSQNLRASFNKMIKTVLPTSPTAKGADQVDQIIAFIPTLSMGFMRLVFSMSCVADSVSVKQMQLVLLHVVLRSSWIQSGFCSKLQKCAMFILGKIVLDENDLLFLAPQVKKKKTFDSKLFSQLNGIREQTLQLRTLVTTNVKIQSAICSRRHVHGNGSRGSHVQRSCTPAHHDMGVKVEVKSEVKTTKKEAELGWLKFEILKGSGKASREELMDAELNATRLSLELQKSDPTD
jgi:hypothetical protein